MRDCDAGSRTWFEAYLDAFNRGDIAQLADYHADALLVEGEVASLLTRKAVRGPSRTPHARMELVSFVGSAERLRIAAEIRATWVDGSEGPSPLDPAFAADDRSTTAFVFLDIAAGRVARIRSAPLIVAPSA